METLCKIEQSQNYVLTLRSHFIFFHSYKSFLYFFCKKSQNLGSFKLPFSIIFIEFYNEENFDFVFCLLTDKQLFCLKTDRLSISTSLQKHATKKLLTQVEAQCLTIQNSSKLLFSSNLNKITIHNITSHQDDFPSLKLLKIISIDNRIPNHLSNEDFYYSNFKIYSVISSIRLQNENVCESLEGNFSSNELIMPQRLFNILFNQQNNCEVSILCSPTGKVFWCCGMEVNVLIKMPSHVVRMFVMEVDFEKHQNSSKNLSEKLEYIKTAESENSTDTRKEIELPPLKKRKIYKELNISCLLVVCSNGEIAVFTSMNKKVFYIQIPSMISCCDLVHRYLIYSTNKGIYQVDIESSIRCHVAQYIDECVHRKRSNLPLKTSLGSAVVTPCMVSDSIINNFIVNESFSLEGQLGAYGMTSDGRVVKALLSMRNIPTGYTNKMNKDIISPVGLNQTSSSVLPPDIHDMLRSLEELHVKTVNNQYITDSIKRQLKVLFDLFKISSFGSKDYAMKLDKPHRESLVEISPLHPTLSLYTIVVKTKLPRFSQPFYTHSPSFIVSLTPTLYTENLQSTIYKLYNLHHPQIDDSVINDVTKIPREKEAHIKNEITTEEMIIITELVEENFPITIKVCLAVHALIKSFEFQNSFHINKDSKDTLQKATNSFLIPLSRCTLAWADVKR